MKTGDHWLSDAEQGRVNRLAGLRRLFAGEHREHFFRRNNTQHSFKAVGPNMQAVLYIADNLPGMCTLKHADLLFGEELAIEPEGGEPAVAAAIARIVQASRLHPVLYQLAATAGWAGRSYVQAVVEQGKVRLEHVEPETVFPRYAAGGDRLAGAAIKFTVQVGEETYCRVIDHRPGLIVHELWRLDSTGKVEAAAPLELVSPGLPTIQETVPGELAVVEIPNFTPGGMGASDYDGGESLMDEVNNRLTQVSRILDEHGDPAVVALESLFDSQGRLKISGRAIRASSMKDGDPVKYVTWDAKLEMCAAQLDRAMHAFLRHMEVSPGLVGLAAGATSADTWKKFKLQIGQTLSRVKRKKLFLAPAIQAALRLAFLLENKFALGVSYPVVPVVLTFSDGLPADDEEVMRVVTGYHAAGLMSDELALTWIHGDPRVVAQELERLATQREAGLPTAFRGAGMGQANEAGDAIRGPTSPDAVPAGSPGGPAADRASQGGSTA